MNILEQVKQLSVAVENIENSIIKDLGGFAIDAHIAAANLDFVINGPESEFNVAPINKQQAVENLRDAIQACEEHGRVYATVGSRQPNMTPVTSQVTGVMIDDNGDIVIVEE